MPVFGENFFDLGVDFVAVHIERLFGHLYAAEGLQRAFEGLVGLQTDYLFEVFIYIARPVRGERGNYGGIGIQNAARFALLFGEFKNLVPQLFGGLGRGREEFVVALVGGIVALDKVAHVDFVVAPLA